jgi:hypothetical protein
MTYLRAGLWCSFSFLAALPFKFPMRRTFPMKNQWYLWHAVMQSGGTVRGAPDRHQKGPISGSTALRILVMALALASLGAVAAVMSGHGAAGHASTRQPAGYTSVMTVTTSPAGTAHIPNIPWMY